MTPAAAQPAPDLPELRRQLRRVALGLFARQLARALPAALCTAGAALSAALLLLVLLPGMLFSGALLPAPVCLALFTPAGAVIGAAWALRRLRLPGLSDAALALESRLGHSDGSLATVLETRGPFALPLADRARRELAVAMAAPAPHLLSTRALLVAPLALLAAVGLSALAWDVPAGAGLPGLDAGRDAQRPGSGLTAIDTGASRGAVDSAALAEAQGLRRAAADLTRAAAQLRQAATQAEAARALDTARAAQAGLTPEQRVALELPAQAPETPQLRARLADDIAAAGGALGRRAESVAGKAAGGQGGTGDPGDLTPPSQFVAFPAPVVKSSQQPAASELAGQSPARRALVARALESAK